MLDPKNLQAVFISFGLTLWDALPLFLVVSIASAIFVRTLLRGERFDRVWIRRRLAGLAGAAYLFLLGSDLLTCYLIIVILSVAASIGVEMLGVNWQGLPRFTARKFQRIPFSLTDASTAPSTELKAVTSTAALQFSLVLAAAAISAVLKVYGTELEWPSSIWTPVAVVIAFVSGLPPGAAAIPAASIASVSGDQLPRIAWLTVAALVETLRVVLAFSREIPVPARDVAESTNRKDEAAARTSTRRP